MLIQKLGLINYDEIKHYCKIKFPSGFWACVHDRSLCCLQTNCKPVLFCAHYMVTTLSRETAMTPWGVIYVYKTVLNKLQGQLYGSCMNWAAFPFIAKSYPFCFTVYFFLLILHKKNKWTKFWTAFCIFLPCTAAAWHSIDHSSDDPHEISYL